MVSIIIPIYNTEKYLEKCLKSIENQTYKDFEVIMVNDGSSDKSAEIAENFEVRDTRFHFFSQENEGVSAARNKGLTFANGEYIVFIDSDDWVEPKMIEILFYNLVNNNADISCCQYDRVDINSIDEIELWTKEKSITTFLVHRVINGSLVNKLIKRSSIGDVKLDLSIKYGEDALFLWKVLFNINNLVITNKVLYHVTLHDDSASGGGSYKEIRIDCISVWKAISKDADIMESSFKIQARAQLANMAFFSLYEMMYYDYKNDIHEQIFVQTIVNNLYYLLRADFISTKEKIIALIITISKYWGLKIISIWIKNLKKKREIISKSNFD